MLTDRQNYFPNALDLLLTARMQERFHERAAAARRQQFGPKIFVRAVVEVSNYCRQNCVYCGMRRDNRTLERFRASHEQITEWILQNRPASVTDLNIQAGEDPVAARGVVVPLVRALRRETNLGISVCLGSLQHDLYNELKAAGATIYILKFETANATRYRQMQSPGTLEERAGHIQFLAASGWKVGSGFIAGLPGQNTDELVENLHFAASLPLDGCSVSPFVPGDETPLSTQSAPSIDLTLNCMAALRMLKPAWVIPAVSALNLAEPGSGYRRGLRTGANLVTINLTPPDFRGDYLLYKRERFIMTEEIILNAIEAEGLQPSEMGLAQHYASPKAQLAVA